MIKKNKFKYIFKGLFDNYDDCYKNEKNIFYLDKDYENSQKKIINIILKNLLKKKPIPPFYKQHTHHLINNISLFKDKKINILDVGGGWGVGYANCMEVFNKKKLSQINYNIFDFENICNIGDQYFKNKIKLKHKKINFYSNLDIMKHKKFDIIFFGSSLQYFKKPLEILEYISNFDTSYLLFIDTYLVKCPSFFTLQKYYQSSVPHSFINEKKFLKIFQKNFSLILNAYSHTSRLNKIGEINMKNFPIKYRLDNSFNLMFKKK